MSTLLMKRINFSIRKYCSNNKINIIGHEHHEKTITVVKKVPEPYPVEKTVHVPVEKKVPYPVKVHVPQPYPVEKKIHVPYKVPVHVKVPVHKPVPVEKIEHYPVKVSNCRRIKAFD